MPAPGTSYFLSDALGSTMALADGAGAVQTAYAYEPFGGFSTSGASTSNPSAFTGREADGTGLSFYRARYYHPQLQRFVSEDPLGEQAGINVHSYVGNKPTLYIDPTGLLERCCRPVNIFPFKQLGAQHCFVRLSDGTTVGGYNRAMRLRPLRDADEGKCPNNTPDCEPLPGNEDDVRKAGDRLKHDRLYGVEGTSNRTPYDLLNGAGIPFTMPGGAIGKTPWPALPVTPVFPPPPWKPRWP